MERETPAFAGINAKTPADLAQLTDQEIRHLPDAILVPILIQAQQDRGSLPMDDTAVKRTLESVRRGHWVPGLPHRGPPVTQQDIDDLF